MCRTWGAVLPAALPSEHCSVPAQVCTPLHSSQHISGCTSVEKCAVFNGLGDAHGETVMLPGAAKPRWWHSLLQSRSVSGSELAPAADSGFWVPLAGKVHLCVRREEY